MATENLKIVLGDAIEDLTNNVESLSLDSDNQVNKEPITDSSPFENRIPNISMDVEDQKPFFKRDESLKPPKSGQIMNTPFPPPPEQRPEMTIDPKQLEQAIKNDAREKGLTIQVIPKGPVRNPVRQITMNFSEPMIPVTSLDQITEITKELPIKLEPNQEGKWSWKGAQTLQFESEHRINYSTDYTITVGEGLESVVGNKLTSPAKFSFSTQTLQFSNYGPAGQTNLRPYIYIIFNQKINPESILKYIVLKSSYGESTHEDITMETIDTKIIRSEPQPNTAIAFRPIKDLQKNTHYSITLKQGAPSAEGPLTTPADMSFTINTYPPFSLVDNFQSYNQYAEAHSPFVLYFTTPVNRDKLRKEHFKVTPELDFEVACEEGSYSVLIKNKSKSNTTYKIELSKEIRDIYDQSLESPYEVTITTGPPYASLTGPSGMIILDPSLKPPTFPILSYNYDEVRVHIYQVTVDDWDNSTINNTWLYTQNSKLPSGKKVYDEVLKFTELPENTPNMIKLDLQQHLQHKEEALGQLLIIAEPTEKSFNKFNIHGSEYQYRNIVCSWVQVTEMSLDIFTDSSNSIDCTVWATKIVDGKPIQGVDIKLNKRQATTNDQGIASCEFAKGGTLLVTATKGKDVTFNPNLFCDNSNPDNYSWFVFDDRNLYQPGETVHIKGYLRQLVTENSIRTPKFVTGTISYEVSDSRGQSYHKGDLSLNQFSAFSLEFKIPDNVNLQSSSVRFVHKESNMEYVHYVRVEEFKRPEFEASSYHTPTTVKISDIETPNVAVATAQAKYYAGGPLTDARINWNVSVTKAVYNPPNWSDFVFTEKKSYRFWRNDNDFSDSHLGNYYSEGKLDETGTNRLKITYKGVEKFPVTLKAHASVTDMNYQAMETSTSFLIHSCSLYVGYQNKTYYGKSEQPIKLKLIVTDIDGNAVPDIDINIHVTGSGKEQKLDDKGLAVWGDINEDQEFTVKSGKEAIPFEFVPKFGGKWNWNLTVRDSKNRTHVSGLSDYYVIGGQEERKSIKITTVPTDTIELVADKENYLPGETARILVKSPIVPAQVIALVRTSGAPEKHTFTIESETYTFDVLIKEQHIPSLSVHFTAVGSLPRAIEKGEETTNLPENRPALAVGTVTIKVPPKLYELSVKANPISYTVAPGDNTSVTVTVTNNTNNPVSNCEVCLFVVDESVLSLAGVVTYNNPLDIFYSEQIHNFMEYHLRNSITYPELKVPKISRRRHEFGSMERCCKCCCACGCSCASCCRSCDEEECFDCEGGFGGSKKQAKVRKNFDPLATFTGSSVTDNSGNITINFTMPDNLTRYRVVAYAATEKLFGLGESNMVAELPVMIRPSPPRFFNFGDVTNISTVVQNQLNQQIDLVVGLRATNASINGSNCWKFSLGPLKRTSLTFPVSTISAGTARFQFYVFAGNHSDVSEMAVRVMTPATTEAFATYGSSDSSEVSVLQPVLVPEKSFLQFGGLEISTSSTAVQALTDAVIYLYNYPFECGEQLASRVLGVLALRDVLTAFNSPDLPPPEKILEQIESDIKKMEKLQVSDGGFKFWQSNYGNNESSPYISVHITYSLSLCLQKGYNVPHNIITRATHYLQNIEKTLEQKNYGKLTKNAITSYSLFVLKSLNVDTVPMATKLFEREGIDGFSMESLGWLMVAMTDANGNHGNNAKNIATIIGYLNNNVNETAETANFITSYGDDGAIVMLHSDRRTDAVLLLSLLLIDPNNRIIIKLAKGLLAHKKAGKWRNTQENCFALVSLDKYFSVYEKVTPDFVTRIWLGDDFGGDHKFVGRETVTRNLNIPMKFIDEHKNDNNLILNKNGPGRLYYRIAMKYAPLDLKLKEANYGFKLERSYLDEDGNEIKRDSNGQYSFKIGGKVRILLRVTTVSRRYHVAMVDYLPSGLEPINSSLKGTVSIKEFSKKYDWSSPIRKFYPEHVNLRDERAESFTSLLWEGIYEWTYAARATTTGTFVTPPAKVEEMYSPEIFGRSQSEIIVIS